MAPRFLRDPGTMKSAFPRRDFEDRRSPSARGSTPSATRSRRWTPRRSECVAAADLRGLRDGGSGPHRGLGERPGSRAVPRGERREGTRFRVGYLGAIVPEKGVHVLVDALNHLSDLEDVEGSSTGSRMRARRTRASSRPRTESAGAVRGRVRARGGRPASSRSSTRSSSRASGGRTRRSRSRRRSSQACRWSCRTSAGWPRRWSTARTASTSRSATPARSHERMRELHADRTRLLRLSAARPLVKTIAEDAQDLEARYRKLVESAAR